MPRLGGAETILREQTRQIPPQGREPRSLRRIPHTPRARLEVIEAAKRPCCNLADSYDANHAAPRALCETAVVLLEQLDALERKYCHNYRLERVNSS